MLKALLKKQLAEIFRSYFYDAKKNKPRSRTATVAYFVLFALLVVVVLGGMFAFVAYAACAPLQEAGVGWLYFTLMGLLAVLLGAFGSVFNTYSGLYLAKDNDLLLSMPIPVHTIMVARLLGVYLMGLMYSGAVMIPAGVVYLLVTSFSAAALLGVLVTVFLVSLIVLMLSCGLGYVVARISVKLKNRSLMVVLLSLLFIGLYYVGYSRAEALIANLIEHAAEYGAAIQSYAYPLYLFGRMGQGDFLAMLIWTLAVALLFVLLWVLLSRSFLRIATAAARTGRVKARRGAEQVRSVDAALRSKEFRRFFTCPSYMLNCGLGTLLLVILGGVMLVKGREVLGELFSTLEEGYGNLLQVLLCLVVLLVTGMNNMATPSVSLEGKGLWQLQSLPVLPWQVLRAKLSVQLLLTGVPALFCFLCVGIAAGFPPLLWPAGRRSAAAGAV